MIIEDIPPPTNCPLCGSALTNKSILFFKSCTSCHFSMQLHQLSGKLANVLYWFKDGSGRRFELAAQGVLIWLNGIEYQEPFSENYSIKDFVNLINSYIDLEIFQ
jgi:hypothetical protein